MTEKGVNRPEVVKYVVNRFLVELEDPKNYGKDKAFFLETLVKELINAIVTWAEIEITDPGTGEPIKDGRLK